MVKIKIENNAKDISDNIIKHLDSLQIKDEIADKSDMIIIRLVGKELEIPADNDEIKLYLDDVLYGAYKVQTTELSDHIRLNVIATGTDFQSTLKEKKSKTYAGTIKDIFTNIAKENQLKIRCEIESQTIYNYLQNNESALQFIKRISSQHNLILTIKNNTLIIYSKEKIKKQADKTIKITEYESISVKKSNRAQYQSCSVEWHDTITNQIKSVMAGNGCPQLKILKHCKNEEEALEIAKRQLSKQNSKTIVGTLKMKGKIIFAGNNIEIDDQSYQIEQAIHEITPQSWNTMIRFTN